MTFPNDYYDGSFGGTSFWEQFPGQQGAEHSRQLEDTLIHIPGGNTIIQQTSGLAPHLLELVVVAALTQRDALEGKVGQSGSLVYQRGTRTARLRGMKDRRSSWEAVYVCTLSFLLT